jgi:hypothetical protein
MAASLQQIAERVIVRAREQGSVTPGEVREEVTRAGEDESFWKDVVALARSSLTFRDGSYHYDAPVSERVQRGRSQQEEVTRAVRELIRRHRDGEGQAERRTQDRIDFIQPVRVCTEDGRDFTLLSRDLSPTGIRLIGTRRLLGQKVRVLIARPDHPTPWSFLVRVLWTCAVGDDLVENGGTFVEVRDEQPV